MTSSTPAPAPWTYGDAVIPVHVPAVQIKEQSDGTLEVTAHASNLAELQEVADGISAYLAERGIYVTFPQPPAPTDATPSTADSETPDSTAAPTPDATTPAAAA